jgi:sulfatase maturation enzyme AslB (radical SAM superfamily)
MTKETAKAIIDLLFRMYDEDKPDAFINHTTHGIILDFIGGEPLMNVEIMEFATEYFIDQCLQKNHEWLYNFRTSFATNGILYFEPKV